MISLKRLDIGVTATTSVGAGTRPDRAKTRLSLWWTFFQENAPHAKFMTDQGRHGPISTVELSFERRSMRFINLVKPLQRDVRRGALAPFDFPASRLRCAGSFRCCSLKQGLGRFHRD